MIDIRVQGSIQELEALMAPESLRKAQRSTLRTIQRMTATRVHRKVTSVYNVTQRAIASRLKMSISGDNTQAILRWTGRKIGLINFGAQFRRVQTARGPRQGASARIRKDKGRFTSKGGFIATGANGNVQIFQREKKDQSQRLPIRAKYGPAIPEMIDQPEVFAEAERFVAQEYRNQYARNLAFYFEKGL